MRILVAEDDPGLRSVLQRGLERGGYVVDAVEDGTRAHRFLQAYDYEVAIVDWRMPGISGVDLVAQVRSEGVTTPVLMLTARDTTEDRVQGLDAGADDYLVKPFEFAELLARIRALQRRPVEVLGPLLAIGDLTFDPVSREVRCDEGVVSLTARELAIFELLVRRTPSVVARPTIAVQVWDDEVDAVGSNTIDVHLARLRGKLDGHAVRIETVRGVGYRIVAT